MRFFFFTSLIFIYSCGSEPSEENKTSKKSQQVVSGSDESDLESGDQPSQTTTSEGPQKTVEDQIGSVRSYQGIMSFLEAKLLSFESSSQAQAHCQIKLQSGHIYKDVQSGTFKSCLNDGWQIPIEEAKIYYKAFVTEDSFFRQFSGFILVQVNGQDDSYQVNCARFPEETVSEVTKQKGEPLENLCGSTFAFNFSIENAEAPHKLDIQFGGGAPETIELGTLHQQ